MRDAAVSISDDSVRTCASGGDPPERGVECLAARRCAASVSSAVQRDAGLGERDGALLARRRGRPASRRSRPRGRRGPPPTASPAPASNAHPARTRRWPRAARRRGAPRPAAARPPPRRSRLLGEHLGAAHHRRRRVVQLVRQAGGQLAERDELLVAQVARGELPRAIDHRVHQRGRDHRALADHLRQRLLRRSPAPPSAPRPPRRWAATRRASTASRRRRRRPATRRSCASPRRDPRG